MTSVLSPTRRPMPGDLWRRDWELLYRASEILWPGVCEHPAVLKRRRQALDFPPTPPSDREAARVGPDFDALVRILCSTWCRVFDGWRQNRKSYVFDDAYAVLFFLRILWANNVVLARGHYDCAWILTTTRERALEQGKNMAAIDKTAEEFVRAVEALPAIREMYGVELPEGHRDAILQHYGFPTDLLDFTFSLETALYFAEGDAEDRHNDPEPEMGTLFALPSHRFARSGLVVTLPPGITRPSLQRGVFLRLTSDIRDELMTWKFVFRHQFLPVWSAIGDLSPGSPTGLRRYLFPASDMIEEIATAHRACFEA